MAFATGFDAAGLPLALPADPVTGNLIFNGFAFAPGNPIVAQSANALTFNTISGATVTWKGSNLKVDGNNQVIGGEVTEFLVKLGDQPFYQISGLTGIKAAELYRLSGDSSDANTIANPFFDYLLASDDIHISTKFDDRNFAWDGDDHVFGLDGNDFLSGGKGNDHLWGGAGNDTLTGIDPFANNPGAGERDVLHGGFGKDTFILGDAKHFFYSAQGKRDYATIADFEIGQDKIQLNGSATEYTLQRYRNGCGDSTGIYRKGAGELSCSGRWRSYGQAELIGVVANIRPDQLSLTNATQFSYAAPGA